ncbi:mitochondrial ribosomal protein L15 precursor, putative [Babesia caballi]|uniref:Mitochondrial ribosomal protein L15, putative n=1 Tax=Babesia caballi TaxID=5871 RepID=A0AAV4LSY3_BABCB|nr:mitochondrial ribosomal protein L15 precursor, putative [Babesia caballi]
MFLRSLERSLTHRICQLNFRHNGVAAACARPWRARCFSASPSSSGAPDRDLVVVEDGRLRGVHFRRVYGCEESPSSSDAGPFTPHPFNRRFAFSKRPLFPIEPRNLRIYGLRRHKKRGRGKKSSARGYRFKRQKRRGSKANSRTFEGGQTPLFKRLPKWPEAWLSRQRKTLDPLNLAKLRYFIERGRLDTRFPITQRHLHDSKCVKVKRGVQLFNVNDYPFPYKIDIEVAGSDQSSIDAIKNVGGSVTIVYHDRVNLRAHLKPYKFEVLPRTARPSLDMVHYLEKMRARGCNVVYIKPLWLIKEEKAIAAEMAELEAETLTSSELNPNGRSSTTPTQTHAETPAQREERLVKLYRERLLRIKGPPELQAVVPHERSLVPPLALEHAAVALDLTRVVAQHIRPYQRRQDAEGDPARPGEPALAGEPAEPRQLPEGALRASRRRHVRRGVVEAHQHEAEADHEHRELLRHVDLGQDRVREAQQPPAVADQRGHVGEYPQGEQRPLGQEHVADADHPGGPEDNAPATSRAVSRPGCMLVGSKSPPRLSQQL